ncbi:MAG: DUF5119 domain-containing protein, partial [Duncaniella sp.]|nr:DUF5119 domain-containing protein [Duncaniella sp.]
MKLSRIQLLAIMVTVMSAMTSCRDELCYNHYPSLDVSLSWEHEWERDYGMNHSATWDASLHGFGYEDLRPGKPEWVNLIRFAADGSRHENFLGNDGANVMMDMGEGQSLLLYNGDTEYIILSDIATPPKARASATARTRTSLAAVSERHPDARTTNPPDVLYSAYVSDIPSVKKHENRPQPVKMQPLVYTYVVRYEFEYGLEHVALARGALGGMAESVYLLDGRSSDESTIIIYDCEIKDYGCEAHVRSFGVPAFPDEYYGRADDTKTETPARPYTLNLEVRLNNGKYVEFNTDISDQIAKQPRGGVIKVSGLRIEDEVSMSEAGFNV